MHQFPKFWLMGLFSTIAPAPVLAVSLHTQCIVDTWDLNWDAKGGTAVEYKTNDSNYRMYKPQQSRASDGGLYVSFKMDHIRGIGWDDHAIVGLTFNSAARLVAASVQMDLDGYHDFTVTTGDPRIDIASKIGTSLYNKIMELNEHGGRLYFATDIKHNINVVDNCTW